MMKKLFLGFLVAIALGACSSEENEPEGAIVLTGGTQTSQTIYADETQKSEGIKFTATEPWTATVTETKTRADGSNVDWLKLSAYSGGAGEFTLNLTLTPNTSGKSRKAEIRITAGKTVLTIAVEQKAETESGTGVLKTIKKIACKEVFNSDKVYNSSDYTSEWIRTFSYDEQGRVARIVRDHVQSKGKTTTTFDYTIAGEITMNEKEVYDSSSNIYEDTYIIKLNEQGNVASIQDDDKNTGTFSDYIRFSYTDDNRLAQWKDADAGSETSSGTFSYDNGMLSKYEYVEGKSLEDSRTISVDVNKAYTHRYPNNLPVDMVGLLLCNDDDFDFLFYIGRTGKTSDYLPEMFPDFTARDEWDRIMESYQTPNTTVEEYYHTIVWSDDELVMNYTFDKDNYLTGIQTQRGFTVVKTTYTVVVGNELVDPNIPERGYKYTIENKKTEKEKDDADVFTWTIEY